MKQILVKGGTVHVEEVPPPQVAPGMALVRVSHSLISSGTESSFVSEGGTAALLLKKARDPLNIEKVKRKIASVGVKSTLELVKGKLFEFQAPGYSTAGVIVACGEGVPGLRVGDPVACAGVGYASHAEYNLVPHQLITPVPEGVPFEEACFVALGAIAMQGVRRAEASFGETVVVLGLGLIGQLAAQICRAAGCHVIGCDPVAAKRDLAQALGIEHTAAPDALPGMVAELSGGHGADAVLICAASKESGVTNQALDLCRQRGRVTVVGAVGLHLQREPLYMKELDFRLSCSYGPGRYVREYEEKGLDFPIGHVRWTEGRNMTEFLRMLAAGRVRVRPLISVTKPVAEAAEAYSAVLSGGDAMIAALISYGMEEAPAAPTKHSLPLHPQSAPQGGVGVAVIGVGAFAQGQHLPNLKRMTDARLVAVAARTGASAKQAGEKYGARYCTADYQEVLRDPEVQAVIISTRHNLHAEMALAAVRAGKHVFVEKPLALRVEDCQEILEAAAEHKVLLTVGFNRRFSRFARAMKQAADKLTGQKMLLYRCNAGALPKDHWTLDPEEGGGRILGEAVHFFDFCCWLLGHEPASVQAERAGEQDYSVHLRFPDNSLATILYTTLGHSGLGKERVELFGGGGAVVLDDFRSIAFHGMPGKNERTRAEDKGQEALLAHFIAAVRGREPLEITAADGLRATRIALQAMQSAAGEPGS